MSESECVQFLVPLQNGYWWSLGFCCLLFIPLIVLAVLASTHYLRQRNQYDDGYQDFPLVSLSLFVCGGVPHHSVSLSPQVEGEIDVVCVCVCSSSMLSLARQLSHFTYLHSTTISVLLFIRIQYNYYSALYSRFPHHELIVCAITGARYLRGCLYMRTVF